MDLRESKEERPPRKRQRKVLSCEACHRQKVKCDRRQPCIRCIAGNRPEQCTYQSGYSTPPERALSIQTQGREKPSTTPDSTVPPHPSKPLTFTVYRKGRARFSGWTHWAQLCRTFEEVVPFIEGDVSRELAGVMKRVKEMKSFYPKKIARAFPFGDSVGNSRMALSEALSILPSKEVTASLAERYLTTFDQSHPLLQADQFRSELDEFWKSPETACQVWLAQLFLMLALSSQTKPSISLGELQEETTEFATGCINGAEAMLLANGRYMTKPDIPTLRVLAMLAIAKRMDFITLNDSDALWVYMGFVVKVAMSQNLHIASTSFPGMPSGEAIARTRIWTTIMLLIVTTSIEAGMPVLLRPEDYDSSAIYQSEQRDHGTSHHTKDSGSESNSHQKLLSKTFLMLLAILNRVNTPDPSVDANLDEQHDMCLRQLLQDVQSTFSEGSKTSNSRSLGNRAYVQSTVLEILLHRALLSLHHKYVLDPELCQDPAHSRRTIHQSCFALLQIHDALHNDPSRNWLADLYIRDISIPGIYIAAGLRNHDFDETPDRLHPESSKAAAWSAFKEAHKRARENIPKSIHSLKVFRGFALLRAVLEGFEAKSSIPDALRKAGLEVITATEQAFCSPALDVITNQPAPAVDSAFHDTFALPNLEEWNFEELFSDMFFA